MANSGAGVADFEMGTNPSLGSPNHRTVKDLAQGSLNPSHASPGKKQSLKNPAALGQNIPSNFNRMRALNQHKNLVSPLSSNLAMGQQPEPKEESQPARDAFQAQNRGSSKGDFQAGHQYHSEERNSRDTLNSKAGRKNFKQDLLDKIKKD